MKRKVLALALGAVAAVAVLSAFSSMFVGLDTARAIVVLVATLPLAILVGKVLEAAGADAGPGTLAAIGFFQWLLLGYALGGILFREKTLDTRLDR